MAALTVVLDAPTDLGAEFVTDDDFDLDMRVVEATTTDRRAMLVQAAHEESRLVVSVSPNLAMTHASRHHRARDLQVQVRTVTCWVHHKHLRHNQPRAGRGRHRSTPGSTSAELEPRLTSETLADHGGAGVAAATVADASREVRDRTLSAAAQAIDAAVLAHPALDHSGRRAIGARSRAR